MNEVIEISSEDDIIDLIDEDDDDSDDGVRVEYLPDEAYSTGY